MVRATIGDLDDHLAKGAEHVVAAGLEDQVVKPDVGGEDVDGEDVDEGAGLAEATEIYREFGDGRALRGNRIARRVTPCIAECEGCNNMRTRLQSKMGRHCRYRRPIGQGRKGAPPKEEERGLSPDQTDWRVGTLLECIHTFLTRGRF